MPIGTGIVYNVGDLILSQVSSSGTAFLETKIAAATSSLIYFDSTARINSASLNSITVGTASYVSGSRSIITNLTASNISASGTSSFGYVGIGTTSPGARLDVRPTTATAYQGTVPYQTTTAAILSPVMAAASVDTYTSILQLVSVRQALVAGRYAHGYLGFSTVDNSNISGLLDAGRISIKNDDGIDLYSSTSMGFWTNTGGSASNPATERVRIASDGNVGIGTTSPLERITFGSSDSIIARSSDTTFNSGYCSRILFNQGGTGYGYLGFYTYEGGSGGGERMRIAEGGNVGIGTTVPVNKLQVAGNISGSSFTSSISNAVGFLGTSSFAINASTASYVSPSGNAFIQGGNSFGTTATLGTNDASALIFETNGTGRVTIDTNGNVGIGTSNPSTILTLSKPIDAAAYGSGSRALDFKVYFPGYDVDSVKASIYVGVSNQGTLQTTKGYLAFLTSATSGSQNLTEKMRIESDGNIGIGTTSPSAKLTIVDNTNGGTINLVGRTSDDTAAINFRATGDGSTYAYVAPDTNEFRLYHNDGFMSFYPGGSEKVRIDSSGNVGIGTTVSTGSLHVYKAAGTSETTVVTIQEGAGGAAELVFRAGNASTNRRAALRFFSNQVSTTTPQWLIGASTTQTNGDDNFYFNNASNTSILTLSQTNVGIGTTVPVAKLQVAGNVSGSSFTSSISNAVGFLGTSSWAQNVVSASYATTAQTANALNASNTYTIAGLTSAYVDVNGSATIPSTGIYRPSSKTLGLSADATLILKINGSVSPYVTSIESGNVGIGSSSPTSKLEVLTSAVSLANQPNIIGNFRGDTDGRSLIRVDNTSTNAGAAALQAGISFVAYSNISNQPSANKHEAQIILGSTGATSVSGGQTGTLQIVAPLDIAFNVSASNTIMTGSSYTTFGSNAMYLARSGNVGIGTTGPTQKLYVKSSTGQDGVMIDALQYSEVGYKTNGSATKSYLALTSIAGGYLVGSTANSFVIRNDSDIFMTADAGVTANVTIKNTGNVGIGTLNPSARLEITGSSNSALLNIKSPISGAILYVSGSGAVGINTSNIGAYTLQVNGSFAATTKSFVIDHPTKAGKRLIYGSLESPYHGIRLTGRDTIKDGKCKVELPDYMYKLILHDSINIQLTGIKCNKTLYVDEINIPENYFTIAYDKGVFESYKDYDFFWDFTAIRADVPELNTEL